jgi:hypothetical protein
MANWDFLLGCHQENYFVQISFANSITKPKKNLLLNFLTVIKNHQDNKTYSGNYGKPYHEFKHLQPINKTGSKKLKQEPKKFLLHNPLEPIK